MTKFFTKKTLLSFLKNNWLLLTIILLGLALRLIKTDSPLSIDESCTIYFAKYHAYTLKQYILTDLNPPLYPLLLKLWFKFFNYSPLIARLPSIIFGTLSILMIYKLGKLLFNRKVGLFAALLLALSTFHIFFSQATRMYAFEVLMAIGSVYYFWKILKDSSSSNIFGYMIFSLLLIYCHTLGFVTILAENIYFLLIRRGLRSQNTISIKTWIKVQLSFLVLFMPWIFYIRSQLSFFIGFEPKPEFSIHSFIDPIKDIFYPFENILILSLLLVPVIFNRLYQTNKRISLNELAQNSKINFLMIWFLLILFVPAVLSFIVGRNLFFDRYLIVCLIPIFILASFGFNQMKKSFQQLIIILLIIFFSLTSVLNYYQNPFNDNWTDLIKYQKKIDNKSPILIIPQSELNEYPYWENPYLDIPNMKKSETPQKLITIPGDPANCFKNIGEFKEATQDYKSIWIIFGRSCTQYEPQIISTLKDYHVDNRQDQFKILLLLHLTK